MNTQYLPLRSGDGQIRQSAGSRSVALRSSLLVIATAMTILWAPLQARAQDAASTITAAMVSEGEQLFTGPGLCFACHGPKGEGLPGVGPNLVDGDWLHFESPTYLEIAELVERGVSAQESKTGVIMLPKGGSQLTPEQLRAVAAYLWSMHRSSEQAPGVERR